MLRLLTRTYTGKVYFGEDEEGIATLIGLVNSFFWVPIFTGLWFHSWWVWFGVLFIMITLSITFFIIIDSFPAAVGGVAAFSLFWGAFGYSVGGLVGKAIGCAPPALIVGIICYMIALFIFTLPLIHDYQLRHRKEIYGRDNPRNRRQHRRNNKSVG